MEVTVHLVEQLKSEAAYRDLVQIVSSVAEREGRLTGPIGNPVLHKNS
jgi:hypothetical protein